MTRIEILLPNKAVEQGIDTPTYLLIYQDGSEFRLSGKVDLAALLGQAKIQSILPLILGLLNKK